MTQAFEDIIPRPRAIIGSALTNLRADDESIPTRHE